MDIVDPSLLHRKSSSVFVLCNGKSGGSDSFFCMYKCHIMVVCCLKFTIRFTKGLRLWSRLRLTLALGLD